MHLCIQFKFRTFFWPKHGQERVFGIAKKFEFYIMMEIDVLKLKNIKFIRIGMPSVCDTIFSNTV